MTQPHACGVDLVRIDRVRTLIENSTSGDLQKLFSAAELEEVGITKARAIRLASRLAAKEACLKLFPRETALGKIDFADFSLSKNSFGAPLVVCSAKAQAVLDLHQIETISISVSHTKTHALAFAFKHKKTIRAAAVGHFIYRFLPIRRALILDNLRKVYGQTLSEAEITILAKAHYAHFIRMALDFIRHQLLPKRQRATRVRVENAEQVIEPLSKQKGVIILTGHFGNFATAISAGTALFPEARGRFYFIRRQLKPAWFEALIDHHFQRAGLASLPKRGSMEAILDGLEQGDALVFPFDQHTSGRKSVTVDFFGHPVGTFRSLALIALASGAPVIPASSWREANGHHVLRFEEPLQLIYHADTREEIRLNTRQFNAALERMILRHPDQWWWVHRRFRR